MKKRFNYDIDKMPIFSSYKIYLLILIAIVLLAYVFSVVDFKEIYLSITKINLYYLFYLIPLSLFEIYLYSLRLTTNLPVKYSFKVFMAYLVGFVFGRVIPPRPFGEYLRFLSTIHYFRLKTKVVVVALIIDNLYDAILLIIFGIIATIFLANTLFWNFLIYLFLIFFAIVFSYFVYINISHLKVVLGEELFNKIYSIFLKDIVSGLKLILSVENHKLFLGVFLTIVNYFVSFLKMYLILLMLGFNINFFVVAAIWSIANLAGNASMLPGGFGAFEISFMYLIADYGVQNSVAISAALIERFFNIWGFAIIGFVYFFLTNINFRLIHRNMFLILIRPSINTAKYIKSKIKGE